MLDLLNPVFAPALRQALTHPRSGEVYALVRADALPDTPETRADLISACNEPLIYDWLFAERCGGQPYSEANARSFMAWMRRGWLQGEFFVFALLSPCGRLVGLLDLKSADAGGTEVGYWLSGHHSGLMTPALGELTALARQAGYHSLYARIRPGNERSLAVLRRLGWKEAGLETGGTHLRFGTGL